MTVAYPKQYAEMFTFVDDFNDREALNIFGYKPDILWPMVTSNKNQPVELAFMRVSVQTVIERQITLRKEHRRFETQGILFIQLFLPRSDAQSSAKGYTWSRAVRDEFRRANLPTDTIFRNARVNEIPAEAKYYRLNVVVEYQFDETQ